MQVPFPHLLRRTHVIYGPFDRQAVVSAVIPQPGKSCKNKRKLYMLLAIRDLLEERGIPWKPA